MVALEKHHVVFRSAEIEQTGHDLSAVGAGKN